MKFLLSAVVAVLISSPVLAAEVTDANHSPDVVAQPEVKPVTRASEAPKVSDLEKYQQAYDRCVLEQGVGGSLDKKPASLK